MTILGWDGRDIASLAIKENLYIHLQKDRLVFLLLTEECYGLGGACHPKVHVLEALSPVCWC
jgi:hypothetical protein